MANLATTVNIFNYFIAFFYFYYNNNLLKKHKKGNKMSKDKGVILYPSHLEPLKQFSNEQLGQIFRGVIAFSEGNQDFIVSDELRYPLDLIRNTARKKQDEYREICEKRRQNALAKHKQANASKSKQQQASADNNNNSNINSNTNNKDKEKNIKKESAAHKRSELAKKIYEQCLTLLQIQTHNNHRSTKIYKSRIARISILLNDYTEDQFITAYKNADSDGWWRKDQKWKNFAVFDHVHRNDHFEKYLNAGIGNQQETLENSELFSAYERMSEQQSQQSILIQG